MELSEDRVGLLGATPAAGRAGKVCRSSYGPERRAFCTVFIGSLGWSPGNRFAACARAIAHSMVARAEDGKKNGTTSPKATDGAAVATIFRKAMGVSTGGVWRAL